MYAFVCSFHLQNKFEYEYMSKYTHGVVEPVVVIVVVFSLVQLLFQQAGGGVSGASVLLQHGGGDFCVPVM